MEKNIRTLITSEIVKFLFDQNQSNQSDSFSQAWCGATERLREIKLGVQKRVVKRLDRPADRASQSLWDNVANKLD